MKYIFSVLIATVASLSFAQEVDTVQRYATMQFNKVERDWKPSMIRVGYDLSRLALTAFTDYQTSQQLLIEFDTHVFFVVGEYGYEENNRIRDFTYENQGSYWKVGLDANLIRFDQKKNVLSMGLRYAGSNFSDQLTFTSNNIYFGNKSFDISNNKISGNWWEFVGGLKIRTWRELFLGYSFHLKFAKQINGEGELFPFDLPGFGRADQKTEFDFNYHIFWTIPFRDKQIPEKPR